MAENEINNQNEMGDALLAEIKELTKKQVRWQRISSLCIAGMLAVVIVVAYILVPKCVATLIYVNTTAQKAEESLVEIDAMVAEMEDASKNLNNLIDANEKSLTEAIQEMSNVDYEGLNKAIKDLQDSVSPLASFFNKFR